MPGLTARRRKRRGGGFYSIKQLCRLGDTRNKLRRMGRKESVEMEELKEIPSMKGKKLRKSMRASEPSVGTGRTGWAVEVEQKESHRTKVGKSLLFTPRFRAQRH